MAIIDQFLLHSGRVRWGDGVGCTPVTARRSRGTGFPAGFAFVSWSHGWVCVPVSVCMCVWWLSGGRVAIVRKCSVLLGCSISLALGEGFFWLPSLEFLDCHINIQLDKLGIKKTQRIPLPYDPPPVPSSLTSLPSSFHPSESPVFVYI